MRAKLTRILLVVAVAWPLSARADSTGIFGLWLTEKKESHVQVYDSAGSVYGRVVWLLNPNRDDGRPKVDEHNPDPGRRQTPVLGLRFLNDLRPCGDKSWCHGTVYDSYNGKTYSCKAFLAEAGVLELRGFLGLSLLGRTTRWTRVR